MKFTYPAVLHRQEDGRWQATLPDLEGCEASGETLDEAVDEANAEMYRWIEAEMAEDDAALPPVSDVADLQVQGGDEVRNICINFRFNDGWDE
ncbi:MAG: type II toxin-antitoxin system HicB family antitoxin [Lachnospiraceae bacterium]|nr:type II toxin-antitoxin system HicB family antitoxin [Lachnospiraceae bacterium]